MAGVICLGCLLITACNSSPNLKKDLNTAMDTTAADTASSADTTMSSTGFTLTDYDVPPSPVQNPMPVYPVKARSSGIQGVCLLSVTVREDGTVGEVTVKKSLLPGEGGLDEAAIIAVRSWIFKPATKDNKPVAATVDIPIPFSLGAKK